MKYLIRSIKYFFYFSIICAAIITVLVIIGAVEGDINAIFEDGYNSIGKIAIFFAIVAAVYPKLAFINRKLYIAPSADIQAETVRFFQERHYIVESQSEDTMTFRVKSTGTRIIKMCEDRITITRTLDGYYMEGHRKDVLRLASGLEVKFTDKED